MLKEAIGLTKKGFSVFPLRHKSKTPACEHGYKDASNDRKKLEELWAGRDGLNVGIATGAISGIFVVDIDGQEGEESFKRLCKEHGEIPKTLTSITGNGRHLFFAYVDGVRTTASKVAPKIDTRSNGGYVVAPPSIHPSGATYRWEDEHMPIDYAPAWLVDLIMKDNAKSDDDIQSLNLMTDRPKSAHLNLSMRFDHSIIKEMLEFIDPDCSHDDWVHVGMALKDEGVPFSIWDSWSAKGTKYVKREMVRRWNSFRRSGVSIGTLVHLAKIGGWKHQTLNTQSDFTSRARNVQPSTPASALSIRSVPPAKEEKEIVDPDTIEVVSFAPNKSENEQINSNNTSTLVQEDGDKKKTIQIFSVAGLKPVLEAKDLVQGVILNGQFSVVYGESNCGKTFFVADMALHIALGWPWRGRRVVKGCVVYVAMEGSTGLANRICAFKQENMILDADFPFFVVPSHVNMLDPKGNISEFLDVLQDTKERYGEIALVVIDTLSRAIAGGDENTAQDMGVLVYHADRIREHTGAHVCFVHHSGKDKAKGARGHSSLRAAVDTEIELSKAEGSDLTTVSFVKQRDIDKGADVHFSLKVVELGHNQYGEPVTSCVVRPVEEADTATKKHRALPPMDDFIYQAILEAMLSYGTPRTCAGKEMQSICYLSLKKQLDQMGYKELETKDGMTDLQVKGAVIKATLASRVNLKKAGKIGFDAHKIWILKNESA